MTRRSERFQMLTVTLKDGRVLQAVYTRDQAALRLDWAMKQTDYKTHSLVDWHCAWCDPRDKKHRDPEAPQLTSGICSDCEKKGAAL